MKSRLTFIALFLAVGEAAAGPNSIRVSRFLPEKPLSRALRTTPVMAILENMGSAVVDARPASSFRPGVRIVGSEAAPVVRLEESEARQLVEYRSG